MLSESQRRSLELATATYAADIDLALPYLAGRGISEQTARMFRLGVVTEDNVLRGDSDYIGRLAIPYITTGGVVQVRFRALSVDQTPKYLSRAGSKTLLFGVTALVNATDTIVLTEGEIDAITWSQCNVPSVGIPGAQNWKDHWRLLFTGIDHVICVCDGDGAGRDFGKRIASEIDGATVIHLPDGMDSNDIFVQQGAAALREKAGIK